MKHRILGDYNVIKPIGQGALGAIFLAEHRFMRRHFALKVLPEELASDRGFIQRFEEEVSFLAALDHPHIVKIHNISFAQGLYFIVSDCVVDKMGETTNLSQYISTLGRSLNEEEIFQILKQVADALDYAHHQAVGQQSLIHRNLKLNNLLIGNTRSGIEVYVSDFGLTRVIGIGAVLTRTFKNVMEAFQLNTGELLQKTGQDLYPNPPLENQKLIPLHQSFLQNYSFLAPEQKRLDTALSVDYKTDVFAFGVLAYFLLMNEMPEGLFELPSTKGLYRYNWDFILNACLQSKPEKRPTHLLPLLDSIRSLEKISVSSPKIQTIDLESVKVSQPIKLPVEELVSVNVSGEEISQEMKVASSLSEYNFNSQFSHSSLVNSSVEKVQEETQSELKPVFHVSQLERPQTDLDPAAVFQIDSTVKQYNPEHKDVTNIKPLLTEMVVVRGGSFYRGSTDGNRDEMPRHQISLDSFAIDIHPVTNEQFVRFLEVMGGEKDSSHNDIIRLRDSRIKRSAGKLSIESGYTKHPVVGVTWYGAVAYAKWVGKRLPTEAEWEIAARGGKENLLYPTGEDIEKSQANFFSSDTTGVMSYAPNGLGLYDMAGNVYEWCHDWYGYNYYELSMQEPENPQGPLQGVYRVLRGGCWKSLKEDLRCSRRHRNNPGTVNGTYGFRCAANVQTS